MTQLRARVATQACKKALGNKLIVAISPFIETDQCRFSSSELVYLNNFRKGKYLIMTSINRHLIYFAASLLSIPIILCLIIIVVLSVVQ